jgi:DNA-binding beta-propeller fold protein YncE
METQLRNTTMNRTLLAACLVLAAGSTVLAAALDEFKVKREPVYEFVQKPTVSREGDKISIAFETKGYCDVTVAIENPQGRIIRHLVSGVLGPRAPKPLQKDSKKQLLLWDGKDDRDVYIDDKDAMTVRVSLGLKPQFEKNLYWSPYKRISQPAPLFAATEEGIIVCEGAGVDIIRLYNHDGKYLRTIYPFPAAKLAEVKGLDWKDFPQGVRYPWKQSLYQQTLLTSGDNCSWWDEGGRHGRAATGIGVCGKDLVLASRKLNRLSTDGASNGRDILGGTTSFTLGRLSVRDGSGGLQATPTSVAISPDNKWVYTAGYAYRLPYNFDTMHGVARMTLDGKETTTVFVGKIEAKEGFASGMGTGPGEFRNATSVDCDAQGRVYVSDFYNDRIQIFSPEGKYLKECKVNKPAFVRVNRKTGEIWAFSWPIPSRLWAGANPLVEVSSELTRIKSFDDPREISRQPIPFGSAPAKGNGKVGTYVGLSSAPSYMAEVDFNASPVTIWAGFECRNDAEAGVAGGNGGRRTDWAACGIRLLREKGGKWEQIQDFGLDTVKQVVRARPPMNAIQRLEVNPLNGKLYVGEADSGPTGKASTQLLEINPETEKIKVIDLPFNPMEFVFDLEGYIYMRNTDMIVRYDATSFRETPFDYGEERKAVGADGGIGGRATAVSGGLAMPSKSPVCYHQGGINVNAKGKIIASCAYRFMGISGTDDVGHYKIIKPSAAEDDGKEYQPTLYPGRISNSTTPCIHIWDKHGKLVYEDAVPGIGQVDGVGLDRDDNIYFMHTANRVLDGKPYFDRVSESLTKVRPTGAKIITRDAGAPVPLSDADAPKRPPDVHMGGGSECWIENAEWFYGGVGFAGFNPGHAPACACWFARFALDHFARSIAPEPTLYSVAVVDSAGNLITRIGRYGNADDGKPLVLSAQQPNPVPLGGDEVGLFYACYVGTHTDRRIFISDVGNGRILSVKLGYYAEEKVPLKGVQDAGKK